MISNEVIEEIRQKADIVDVISRYINVIKKGNSFVAVCPFHNDTNPSMQISQTKQIYKCFACNAGGNVFTFVQDYEKIGFIDAVKKVASIIGYNNSELDTTSRIVSPKVKNVLDALKIATELYSYTLKTKEGEEALSYLSNRNIPLEMIDYFSLGYAPKDGELSVKLIRSKGVSVDSLDGAGILIRNNGQFSDRFKGRLIFPLSNEFGEIVGFSARRIKDSEEAKYVNSLNTVVFNKSKILYNFQNAIREVKNENYVYITEGFMDVFALYKVGIKSSVALMGTSFTEYHAKMLKKLHVELRLCLDGDDAGQNGMLKMIDILDNQKIKYRIVNYKECKLDPDEILQKYGDNTLAKFLNRLISREEFLIEYYRKRFDLSTLDGKKDFANAIIHYVKTTDDLLEKELFLKKISELTNISIETYQNILGSSRIKSKDREQIPFLLKTKPNIKTKYQKVTDELLRLLLNYLDAINKFQNEHLYFHEELNNQLANYIIDYSNIYKNLDASNLISYISQQDLDNSTQLINKIIELTDMNTDENPTYSEKLFNDYFSIYKTEYIKKNERTKKISSLKEIINAKKE